MRNIRILIQGFTLIVILISCENEQEYPLVFTGPVTNITDTSAVFSANISSLGDNPILESGFIWGVHSNDNNGIKIKNNEVVKGIYSLKTNEKLLPGKTYYARAYLQTQHLTSYGREVSFESPNGQINIGNWSRIYNARWGGGSCLLIRSSFTINDITYFAIENGGILYSYNPTTNAFKYVLSNPLLTFADISVVYNGYAYIFSKDALYRFDPQSKTFYKLSVISDSEPKNRVSGFLVEDNIYIGLGKSLTSEQHSKDFWKYNITTDSWIQVAAFPGEYRSYGFSFSINNFGYVGGGFYLTQGWYPKLNDLWCYIPESDKWIQKESLPFENKELYALQGTNTEKFGYCYYQGKFYEYNPIFDIWEKMAGFSSSRLCHPNMFITDNKISILDARITDVGTMDTIMFNIWRYEK